MKYWFTSDEHYHHRRICEYAGRKFDSVQQMNQQLINNHNDVVHPDDVVWHLGDFAFCTINEIENIINQLSGSHYIVLGNHDAEIIKHTRRLLDKGLFKEIVYYKELSITNSKIIMCHYAFSVWNKSHRGSINLYGHSHSNFEKYKSGKQMDVGVDNAFKLVGQYRPFNSVEIVKLMNNVEMVAKDHHRHKEENSE